MKTINSRIEELIEALGITKTAFAERIKVTQPYISKLISGNGAPSNRLIEDICEKYNVNEEWLRTGNGEIFIQFSRDEEIAGFMGDVLNKESDDFKKRFISMLSRLTEPEWELLELKAKELFEEQNPSSDKEQ